MRDFKLKISTRMLELLSQDLYTNIYFVLAELVANAYDADAENVYIFINDNEIRVEDDGNGMSEDELDDVYLLIGGVSRDNDSNARTLNKKRMKMGRKGIGKLSALSISNGFQIITVKDSKPIGIFIPKKIEHDNETLKQLQTEEIVLKKIKEHGTAIIMSNPNVSIPKNQSTIIRNLGRIFPKELVDFNIYVNFYGKEEILTSDESSVISRLATLITVGKEYESHANYLSDNMNIQVEKFPIIERQIEMFCLTEKKRKKYPLRIKGWIGTYKTTSGMKKDIDEFSDNYIAIFAHDKMGQRNVLDFVRRNRVYESYIVGHLYINLFEESSLPDMAATNRQGYNENDPRWIEALPIIRELTDNLVRMHVNFAQLEQKDKESLNEAKRRAKEEELKMKLNAVSQEIVKGISTRLGAEEQNMDEIISQELERIKPTLGFKSVVDANKKKIMISQTLKDKSVSDIIYYMLQFNGIHKDDIIYSNSDDPESNLPERDIYGYLEHFFVKSVSSEMINVIFVTSENVVSLEKNNPALSWGVLMEIGAAWITKKEHWIFNINDFKPEAPLNTVDKYVAIKKTTDHISLCEAMVNSFCQKIIMTAESLGYSAHGIEENKKELKKYVTVYIPS